MKKFHGDLSIGGLRLDQLDGELQQDEALEGTSDHLLAGRLSVSAAERELLELGRPYRLQIEDGPAGIIVVSRIQQSSSANVLVDFEPVTTTVDKPR